MNDFMARTRPRNLQQLIDGKQLRRFTDFTEQYQLWQQLLNDCLISLQLAPLSAYCKVLSVRANTLVIEAASGTIASRLKLQQGRIITHFAANSTTAINQLEVQVRPVSQTPAMRQADNHNPTPAAPVPQQPTTAPAGSGSAPSKSSAASQLRQQAQLCPEPLRSQLLALADKYEADAANES
ncbi:uncharacterized protein DUF721 [Pseudidiomarina tainanensis]|uniref:Uncharacterized protein DUF721 n=3 Tax=Idiomarinaceae TaxID=267893 RepID=A0A368UXM7_9GAMM|nr:uncharacterized protein DUF721 [Pseudidiomarina maritima]RBP90468.1 uncharacterized protein DUF721 [Pseudidiomarina tainanensis]RCW32144.1 uncharacterized protein DUF721 [Pseudidiomarina tainanensis]